MPNKFDAMMPWPHDDYSAYGEVSEQKLGRIQAFVGKVMERNWVSIPHVTHHDEIDISELETKRQTWNRDNPDNKLSILPALMKASVAVLKEYPQFNCSLSDDGTLVYQKHYYHIGVAVDIPGGLLVPVVKNCDTKSAQAISAEVSVLSGKAKTTGLPMVDMKGGCFTISSLGHIGGTAFTPIINAPEVAILGVTKARKVFVPDENDEPVAKLMLPLSLSYDHRVINGADAARFMVAFQKALAVFSFAD